MFCVAIIASADEPPPPPRPWSIDLGDGLVFHYRPEYEHYPVHMFFDGTPTEFKEQGYPQTGLYRDGELVYTVEVQLWARPRFSNDGMTFIEVDWWVAASGDPGVPSLLRRPLSPAIRFFEQGRVVRRYYVRDLVRDMDSIVFTVNNAIWDYQQERYHDRENNTFSVKTREGRDITFDLSTGLIISADPPFGELRTNSIFVIVFVAISVILVFGAVILLISVKRRRNK